MERMKFEPFGEQLVDRGTSSPGNGGASRWLLRAGSAVFWSIVAVIVVARATYFDPAVFDFDRLAAILRSVL